jgi:hypothetical protein
MATGHLLKRRLDDGQRTEQSRGHMHRFALHDRNIYLSSSVSSKGLDPFFQLAICLADNDRFLLQKRTSTQVISPWNNGLT